MNGESEMMNLRDRQEQFEIDAIQRGVERYHQNNSKLVQGGRAGETDWGTGVLTASVAPLVMALEEMRDKAASTAGRRHAVLALFDELPVALVAYVTARSVIDDAFGPLSRTVTPACNHIADRLQTEAQALQFKEANSKLFNTVWNKLDRNVQGSDPKVRSSTLRHAAKKFNVSISSWSITTKIQIGRTLLELFAKTTGLVTIQKSHRGKMVLENLEVSEELMEFVKNFKDRNEVLHPFLQPMVVPPKPWTTIDDGGYLHLTTNMKGIVKSRTKAHREELIRSDLGPVFRAVNLLQNTAWKVNVWLLDQVVQASKLGLHVGDTLVGNDVPHTEAPKLPETDPEYKTWKAKAAEGYRFNRKNKGRRLQQLKLLQAADKFVGEAAIYFPYQLDFRGRVYAVPSFLNPQGNDLAKGLLEFADGKPLGDVGAWWLFIHTANTFGVDKVSYEERVQWTQDHRDRIVATAESPFTDLWWTEADSPWQFLAACRDVAGFVSSDTSYVSHLPVSVDGSNNGLQHFSALGRDSECGSLVNLVPNDEPADIYSTVAKAVEKALEARKDTDELARLWLLFGIDRKLCKRPVMIVPYGGTRDGIRSYIVEAIDEKKGHPFSQRVGEAATYLSHIVQEEMDSLMPGPRQAMKWLQGAARAVAAQGKPVTWTCPNGFIAQQAYYEAAMARVKCFVLGKTIQVRVRVGDLAKIDRKRQVQSFSPNFVHSLDAAALTATVNAAADAGLTHFACVHDSYGSHACDLEKLQKALRDVFAEQYSGDVLKDLKAQLDLLLDEPLPEPPTQGDLDVQAVKQSDYFFA